MAKKSKRLGKRPKINIDTLDLQTPTLEEARKLIKKYPGLISPYQLKVLNLYHQKSVLEIEEEDNISKESVYAVFLQLRRKRKIYRLFQRLYNNLSRDEKLHKILSSKPTREEEDEVRNV